MRGTRRAGSAQRRIGAAAAGLVAGGRLSGPGAGWPEHGAVAADARRRPRRPRGRKRVGVRLAAGRRGRSLQHGRRRERSERRVYRVERDDQNARLLLSLPAGQSAFPGVTGRLWYAEGGALWLLPLEDGEPVGDAAPRRVAPCRSREGAPARGVVQVSPAPDGERGTCGPALCLIDAGGGTTSWPSPTPACLLAWRPDGQQLAAALGLWRHG